jgi:glycyl-tRNA synthetase
MPTAVMGGFNEEFLQLPRDVLISVMKKHQRYFPCRKSKVESRITDRDLRPSTLLPHFIAIRNGDDIGVDIVREGNEHVLARALPTPTSSSAKMSNSNSKSIRPKLATLTFHTKLGSMLDKSDRILKLGAEIGALLGFKGDLNTIKYLGRAVVSL